MYRMKGKNVHNLSEQDSRTLVSTSQDKDMCLSGEDVQLQQTVVIWERHTSQHGKFARSEKVIVRQRGRRVSGEQAVPIFLDECLLSGA
jgi:hypothetical protein